MRLVVDTQDRLVNDTAMRLSGGSLVFFSGDSSDPMTEVEELARVPLPAPAFEIARDGRAIGYELPVSEVSETGIVGWARLETPTGDVVAELTVGTPESETPPDVLVNRLDFHRGGRFTVNPPVLYMPSSS